MTDIAAVDPAIVKASESKGANAAAAPKKAYTPPPLVLATRTVLKHEDGSFNPPVNAEEEIIFATSDGRFAVVEKKVLATTPFASSSTEPVAFAYPVEVLTALVHWCQQYGVSGKAVSAFPSPVVTHTDFTLLLTVEWEKTFFQQLVARHDASETFLGLINAAEKFRMEGLLNFLCVALGCAIRGKSDEEALMTLHEFKAVSDDEIAAASKAYPWLDATKKAKASA